MDVLSIYPLAIITFIISVIFVYVYMRSKENPENMLFAVMGVFLTVFLFGRFLTELAKASSTKLIMTNIGYTALFLFLAAFFHFVTAYNRTRKIWAVSLAYATALIVSLVFVKKGLFIPARSKDSLLHVSLIVLAVDLYLTGILISNYFDKKYANLKEPLSAFFCGGIFLSISIVIELVARNRGLYLEYGLMALCLTISLSLTNEIIRLYKSSAEALRKLEETYLSTIRTFINALDAKDPYTSGHSERVTKLSVAIAIELGMSADRIRNLRLAALLHDAGKLVISEDILLKREKLTDEEFKIIRNHAAMGAEILKPIYFLRNCLGIIRSHHERPDGKGYPDGLRGSEIPIPSSLIAIAEAYDAMVTNSAYRQGMSVENAIKELKANKSTQFYDKGIEAFLKIVEREKDKFNSYIDSIPVQENP